MSEYSRFRKRIEEEINELIEDWGLDLSDEYGSSKKTEICQWLSNDAFKEYNDGYFIYEDAFELLKGIDLVRDTHIKAGFKRICTQCVNRFVRTESIKLNEISLFTIGDTAAEGGSSYLKDVAAYLMVPKSKVVQAPFKSFNCKETRLYVFVDDFIGSSKTIFQFISSNQDKINFLKAEGKKFVLLTLYCFEDKIEPLRKIFDYVLSANVLTNANKAFHPNSYLFKKNDIPRLRMEKWCRHLGEKLYPKGPLGYDDCQCMIAFLDNAPNNTLPIFWAGPESESEEPLALGWKPVFRRQKIKDHNPQQTELSAQTALKKNLFAGMNSLLESSNYEGALTLLFAGEKFESLPIEKQLEIIIVQQKIGLLQDGAVSGARANVNYLMASEEFGRLDSATQARVLLADLKISSQEHQFDKVLESYTPILMLLEKASLENGLKCGVLHRAGVAYAIKGDLVASNDCFEKSLVIINDIDNPHAWNAYRMYHLISNVFRGNIAAVNDPESLLAACQAYFINYPNDYQLWQFNGLKSAVQCLFVEAAYHLMIANDLKKGYCRLAAANLFAPLVKSNPLMEGFAELLAFLPQCHEKEMVKLAMRADLISQHNFQNMLPSRQFLPVLIELITPSFPASKWTVLRDTFKYLDDRSF